MDNSNGGRKLTPEERQRQTAAEIARKKVLTAYGVAGRNDWQKYHTAWQEYYQKYYSEYYAKAAREYLEKNQPAQLSPKVEEKPSTSHYSGDSGAIFSSADTPDTETEEEISKSLKERIRTRASESFHLSKKRKKLIPIFMGVFVALFVLFLQYNRLVFAPIMAYIAPGNVSDAGIQAIDPTVTEAPGADPKLIIPKLNIDVPVAFGIANDSATVMSAMNNGVAHFRIPGASAYPGEVGNVVISGHSAGDIYSSNQYKFIFSGLERLENGDLIYIDYNSVRYTYSVTKKEVVEPTDVQKLVYDGDKSILTLITCTPLGTSRYRLLVTAEQISPTKTNSASKKSAAVESTNENEAEMPSNEDSFFEGIWKWLTGQN